MEFPVKIVLFMVLLVTILVWAAIRLVFWIPLLLRATTVFSLSLLPAAYSHRDLSGLRAGLEDASGFYFRGFRYALAALYEPPTHSQVEIKVGRIIVEIIWVAAFWAFVLYFFQPFFVAPAIRWIAAQVK